MTRRNPFRRHSSNGRNRILLAVMAIAGILVLVMFFNNQQALATIQQYDNGDIGFAAPSNVQSSSSSPPPPPPPTSKNPFGERTIDPILVKSLAKVQGPRTNPYGKDPNNNNKGWDVDPNSILKDQSHDLQCNWLDFRSSTGQTAKMCCHGNGDVVSGFIHSHQRWHDCDILKKKWNESKDKTPNSVYLEIGANIGSCVMEMLLSTDAKIIAFEPHPHNQWMLQKSIESLDPSYQSRFVLVPVGLGRETSANKIYGAARNMGNSVVGQVIKEYDAEPIETFLEYDIFIERLSSIVDANAGIDIPLVKMDVQGFECEVLEGMDLNLAKLIRQIKTEVASRFLREQKCLNFFAKFRELGFTVTKEGGAIIKEGQGEPHVDPNNHYEVIATRND